MNIENYIVEQNISVKKAMEKINKNSKGIVFVCDGYKLLGALSDGNIRRYILGGGDIEALVSKIYNSAPKYITTNSKKLAREFMRNNGIKTVPVVDSEHEIISIKFLADSSVYRNVALNIPVVIMAGGKGTRLAPYTDVLPKPLIPITDKTITELIMDRFIKFGCSKFDMIVNYKKNLIKAYFNESMYKENVVFTDEDEFLGTGGGIKLIEKKYDSTIFLTNCDVILDIDLSDALVKHKKNKNIATVVTTKESYEIPYGNVVTDENGDIVRLEEKPKLEFNANTGLYILEPEFIAEIPNNQFVHVTNIIVKCIDKGLKVGTYSVDASSWQDMGQLKELYGMRKGRK